MKPDEQKIKLIFIVLVLLVFQNCQTSYFRANYKEAGELLRATNNAPKKLYLKAHLTDGKVYILKDSWEVDTTQNLLKGNGFQYDINRKLINAGPANIPLDSVAIMETNHNLEQIEKNAAAGIAVLGILDLALGIYCLTVPKACFGSCPTFYINEEDNLHYAHAEGFSSAVTPSMEYTDVDALQHSLSSNDTFPVVMKNEAWETHYVNSVKLLAAARGNDEQVYHSTGDEFYRCDRNFLPGKATAEEGDITNLLLEADKIERFSLADERNMYSREEIHLTFDMPADLQRPGLLLSFRQSLMSTYLFYSAMDYMGGYATDIVADMERTGTTENQLENAVISELGGIDIYVWNENKREWDFQGSFNETGPIAFNHQLLPLEGNCANDNLKVKLVLNKGSWRIDRAAIVNIRERVEPIALVPEVVLEDGRKNLEAGKLLNNDKKHLVSMPGSTYRFKFVLPSGSEDYDVFLQSRGYYLEWLRPSWLEDSNLLKFRQMIKSPRRYLRTETKSYKEYEHKMEELFWNSRIETQPFSFNEN